MTSRADDPLVAPPLNTPTFTTTNTTTEKPEAFYDSHYALLSEQELMERNGEVDENFKDETHPLHIKNHRVNNDNQDNAPTEAQQNHDAQIIRQFQDAINISHPFGLRIWKPALYQKSRSLDRKAYALLHSLPDRGDDLKGVGALGPGRAVLDEGVTLPSLQAKHRWWWSVYINPGNWMWIALFGIWLCLLYLAVGLLLSSMSLIGRALGARGLHSLRRHARVMINLGIYLLFPFGRFIAKQKRSPDWQDSLMHSPPSQYTPIATAEPDQSPRARPSSIHHARNLNSWKHYWRWSNYPMILFHAILSLTIIPAQLAVCGSLFFLILTIPMSKLNWILLKHLVRDPLALSAHSPVVSRKPVRPIFTGGSATTTIHIPSPNLAPLSASSSSSATPPPSFMFGRPESIIHDSSSASEDGNSGEAGLTERHDPLIGDKVHQTENFDMYIQPRDTINHSLVYEVDIETAVTEELRPLSGPSRLQRMDSAYPLSTFGREYSVLLCTSSAVNLSFYKYTVDGINVVFINLLAVVFTTLLSFYIIGPRYGYHGIASKSALFVGSLVSVVPLAYFIGMSVSSITARTGSVAIGSVLNASFGSFIEIVMNAIALSQGKSRLVEGSLIGSFLCGLLALPGVSMIASGFKRKEMHFNAKAAGVTSTLLLVSCLGVFSPTIFHQAYGTFELKCFGCPGTAETPMFVPFDMSSSTSSATSTFPGNMHCNHCAFSQSSPSKSPIYRSHTLPFVYTCAVCLVLTYGVGLMFTLWTHASLLGHDDVSSSISTRGKRKVSAATCIPAQKVSEGGIRTVRKRKLPPMPKTGQTGLGILTPGLKATLPRWKMNECFAGSPRSVFSDATDVASVASPSPVCGLSSGEELTSPLLFKDDRPVDGHSFTVKKPEEEDEDEGRSTSSSHPSLRHRPYPPQPGEKSHHKHPRWSNVKSMLILLACTVVYSLIAEVLMDSIDTVLEAWPLMDEKLLGLTLFSIVPTITEFYNAIAFAMQGNIALSLEIGSAYAIQVALIQVPALVGMSAWYAWWSHPGLTLMTSRSVINPRDFFVLIFPQWDFFVVLFSVLLLSYIYIEGKSNYFKGGMLLIVYVVVMFGFVFLPRAPVE